MRQVEYTLHCYLQMRQAVTEVVKIVYDIRFSLSDLLYSVLASRFVHVSTNDPLQSLKNGIDYLICKAEVETQM